MRFQRLELDIVGEHSLTLSGAAMEQVYNCFVYILPKLHSFSTPPYFYQSFILNFFFCLLGIESFSKLGDSIYFEEEGKDPTLYIIQYIPSSFNWKSGKILLNQTVVPVASSDPYLRVTFTFSPVEVTVTLLWAMASHLAKYSS